VHIAVFAFGAIIGSFLNAVLFRKNTGESVLKGRSRCFSCGKKLEWFELIPIVSFIIQRGRCRGCGSRISWQYQIIELTMALIALSINFQFSIFNFQFWFYFFVFCSLLFVAVYDLRHKIIDRHFLRVFGVFAVAEHIFKYLNIEKFKYTGFFSLLVSGIIFLFFYSLWRFSSGRWMGRGDADLAFFLALFLGYPLSLFMFLGSFWLGAVAGVILLLIFYKKFTIKSEVPFGPFLALSTFFAWYFADMLKFIYGLLYF